MNQSARAASIKLAAGECKAMAVRALAGAEPVSALAARYAVSPPLVYQQMNKASGGLDDQFSARPTDNVDHVLFSMPVTRRWLSRQSSG